MSVDRRWLVGIQIGSLSTDECRLPSYELLRWFGRFEIALLAASAESSAISLLAPSERRHLCLRAARIFARFLSFAAIDKQLSLLIDFTILYIFLTLNG